MPTWLVVLTARGQRARLRRWNQAVEKLALGLSRSGAGEVDTAWPHTTVRGSVSVVCVQGCEKVMVYRRAAATVGGQRRNGAVPCVAVLVRAHPRVRHGCSRADVGRGTCGSTTMPHSLRPAVAVQCGCVRVCDSDGHGKCGLGHLGARCGQDHGVQGWRLDMACYRDGSTSSGLDAASRRRNKVTAAPMAVREAQAWGRSARWQGGALAGVCKCHARLRCEGGARARVLVTVLKAVPMHEVCVTERRGLVLADVMFVLGP